MPGPHTRPRLGRAFLPALLIAIAVVALGLAATREETAAATGGATVNIEVGDNFFNPKTVAVNVGDTIVWTNAGRIAHDVTASNGAFASPRNLAPGATFSYTATAAGTIPYICTIHVGQEGMITVAAAPPAAAPSAAPATAPGAPPRTGGGAATGGAFAPPQQLLVVGALALAGLAGFVARRLRRAA